jgi:hypothetical protein
VEIPQRETITQTRERAGEAITSFPPVPLCTVSTVTRQDHSHLAELFKQLRTVRIMSCHPDTKIF